MTVCNVVDVKPHANICFYLLRISQGRWLCRLRSCLCQGNVVVVLDDVGVFKVNESVIFVRVQATYAVSVFTFITSKHYFVQLVTFDLAA